MLEVLCSYKETKKQTAKIKRQLEEKLESLERMGEKDAVVSVKNDIAIINAALSDISFVIEWLSKGRMPGARRGVDRQSVYKREVPFEDKWLDILVDKQIQLNVPEQIDEEVESMKEELVGDLKKCLTPKQLEVFMMLGQGMDNSKIAQMLGISRQAVHETIERGRRRIKEAGWMMV